ncbi:MAG: MBL fold metallo-hydrolase [Planctomycetes bacterium]|nr:MBL fold metallo-hydrolase [Planctomycetota bacterium]
MTTTEATNRVGTLEVTPFVHPQGCRGYLVADPESRQAMAIDAHLDLVDEIAATVERGGWSLPYVVDSHTHADHPSGAGLLAARFSSTRIAHAAAKHSGVTRHPEDGSTLHLGDVAITVHHAPGHTPDHIVLHADGVLFSGDTLLIGAVARTDFLGGDAGQLFDTLQRIVGPLDDDVVLYPGHDYAGKIESTIGEQRKSNPWLKIQDRDEFVRALSANPPPRPANMDDLLKLNRDGTAIPPSVPVATAIDRARHGGAGSIIDVRTAFELKEQHVAGARHIPLEDIGNSRDAVRAVPAPRLILCRSGKRAEMARQQLAAAGVSGLSVIEGGILAWAEAGGDTVRAKAVISLERQVRIVAGILVVLSVLLGFVVHPFFFGIAAFVGAGQVFAGVTDRCGMALMLTKLPWNRVVGDSTSPATQAGGCAAKPPAAAGGGCAARPPGS